MDDLKDLNLTEIANDGELMELLHPTKKTPLVGKSGNPMGITFLGYDSDKAKKIRMKTMNEGLNRKASSKVTAEELETRSIKHIARLAVSWQGITEEGKELEFSFEALVKLLTKYSWMKEQCDEFIGDRGNFLKEG